MQRRRVFLIVALVGLGLLALALKVTSRVNAQATRSWVQGKGYGWIWGPNDEIGALNAVTPEKVMEALRIPKEGSVYDLGVLYDRSSFQWPGHSPAEIIAFRTPEGVKRQKDPGFMEGKKAHWHSNAVFISDNVGTQIDSLCHITQGDEHAWYNGYKEADWGGNFGPQKACADKMPPIITRGVLIEQGVYVGEFHNLEALARDRVYEFLYMSSPNKIRGATAGFTMRPVAIK